MLFKKYKYSLGFAFGLIVLLVLLQIGVGPKRTILEIPKNASWVDVRTNVSGVRAVLLEGDEAMTVLLERYDDLVPDTGMHYQETDSPAPVVVRRPRPINLRPPEITGADQEGEGLLGRMPGAPEMPDSSGWGWLADGVRQQQEASRQSPSGEGSREAVRPRRLFSNEGQDDRSYMRPRWFDE
jgi:hypothetical protein